RVDEIESKAKRQGRHQRACDEDAVAKRGGWRHHSGEDKLPEIGKGRATATIASYTLSFRIEKGHLYVSRKSRRGSSESGHWRSTTTSIVPDSRRVRSRLGY